MVLKNKNVVYVGGFGGIGVETAKELLKKNLSNLVILDRKESPQVLEELQAINPKTKIHFYFFDVLKSVEELEKVFAAVLSKIQRIDLLVNGAGLLNEHLPDLMIRTNLNGVVNTTLALLKFWDKRNGGSGGVIVNIASAASLEPHPMLAVYSSTKAGVRAFTKCLADITPLTGVSAFLICPGLTETPMLDSLVSFLDIEPDVAAKVANVPKQSPGVCAEHIVTAIEKNENGSIWLIDNGEISLVPKQVIWTAPEI